MKKPRKKIQPTEKRNIREKLGMTQLEYAVMFQTTRGTIASCESRRSLPKGKRIAYKMMLLETHFYPFFNMPGIEEDLLSAKEIDRFALKAEKEMATATLKIMLLKEELQIMKRNFHEATRAKDAAQKIPDNSEILNLISMADSIVVAQTVRLQKNNANERMKIEWQIAVCENELRTMIELKNKFNAMR